MHVRRKVYEYICITNLVTQMNEELAEICGIHAGDGYLRNDGHRRELDLSGSVEESEYFDEHVSVLFEKVFGIKTELKIFSSRNTYGFVIRKKEIIESFHDLGFPYGNKSTSVRIPSSILDSDNKVLIARFLRGLFDTDGNLSFRKYYGPGYKLFKTTNHVYPVVSITTVSKNLCEDIGVVLKKLGIVYNYYSYKPKKIHENEAHKITVNGISQLQNWMNQIGMKNFSKLSRYLIWKKHGFCPTKLTLQQRKDILKGDISPLLVGL